MPLHHVLDPNLKAQVPPGRCALGIMTKVPRAGRVKTRLTPPLTPDESAALNICFLRDTSAAFAEAVSRGLAQGVGVYTPVGEEFAYENILPPDFALIAQRGELFGDRLIAAASDLFAVGFASVCLIDSDSPTIPAQSFTRAAELLAQDGDRIVFGPSDDGGYFLIGMKKMHPRLFKEIDWSTERVAEQTLDRAREIGVAVEELSTGYDVDDRSTLRRLCEGVLSGKEHAPATKDFLQQTIAREGRTRIWPNE